MELRGVFFRFSNIFVESICNNPSVIEANVREVKTSSPDYVGTEPDAAIRDFMQRIEHYERAYQPIDDPSLSYIKVFDVGRKVEANLINSHLGGRILFYLLNLHTKPRRIWLTRHGQSAFNIEERIGGDPELTPAGELYAHRLAEWMHENCPSDLTVWTSTLRRTIHTGKYIAAPKIHLRSLDEIDAGTCDGLTYKQVQALFPDEYLIRANNKLEYRYPRGESYVDVIQRLEPVIFELERQRSPVLVIAHQAVLRCLFAYFMDRPIHECPFISIPLHTVIEITPKAYGCETIQHQLVSSQEVKKANEFARLRSPSDEWTIPGSPANSSPTDPSSDGSPPAIVLSFAIPQDYQRTETLPNTVHLDE